MNSACRQPIFQTVHKLMSKSCRIPQHCKRDCCRSFNGFMSGKRQIPAAANIKTCSVARNMIRSSLSRSIFSRSISTSNCSYSLQTDERPQAQSTIDEEEIDKFRALSKQWWDEVGEFQALHTMNDLRVPLICDAALADRNEGDPAPRPSHGRNEGGPAPLEGTHPSQGSNEGVPSSLEGNLILDVGCGGGILAEPLARLGATVIGIDATPENIPIAQTHALHDPDIRTRLKYIHCTAEDLVATEAEMFDVVVASEVLEHVSNVAQLVSTCVDLVKPGGSLIFTTINKTWISYMVAVVGAEDIVRVVPPGTHDWQKFIPPHDLQQILEDCGCQVELLSGMLYNPFTHHWSWSDVTSCNYAIHAVKPSQ